MKGREGGESYCCLVILGFKPTQIMSQANTDYEVQRRVVKRWGLNVCVNETAVIGFTPIRSREKVEKFK